MEQSHSPEAPWSGWGRAEHTETGEVLDIFDARYERDKDALPSGIYEHFKSTDDDRRFYQVELVVRDNETNERLVIYEPLYIPVKIRSARPLEMFTESVQFNDMQVPRFRYVGPDTER